MEAAAAMEVDEVEEGDLSSAPKKPKRNPPSPTKDAEEEEDDEEFESGSESEPESEPCRPKSPDPQDDDTVVEVQTNGQRVLYVADDEADNPELRQIKKNIFSLNTFLKEKWKLHKRSVPVWLLKLDGLNNYDRLQFSCNPV